MSTSDQGLHFLLATLGFSSFVLLWLAVVAGSLLRSTWTSNRLRRSTVHAIHLGLAVTGLALGAIHGFAQLIPPTTTIHWLDILVPFVDDQDPIGIGAGVLGLEVMLLAAASVAVQRRLGYAAWRVLHVVSYSAFMLVVVHVLVSGSESGQVLVWLPVLLAWAVTVGLWLRSTPWWSTVRRWPTQGRAYAEALTPAQAVVKVDLGLCSRFGFCEHQAPRVFRLESDGQLSYRAVIDAREVEAVGRAIEACPSRAIAFAAPSERSSLRSGPPVSGREIPSVPGVRRSAISQQ